MPPENPSEQKIQGRLDKVSLDLKSVKKTTELLTSPMDLQQVLEMVTQTIAEAVGADAAGLRLLDNETGALVLAATYGLSDEYKSKGPVSAKESALNQRILNGEDIVVDNMQTDPNFSRYRDEIKREGLVSNMSIGMIYHDKGIGILRIYSRQVRHFSTADVSLAHTVASQSASAIVNARLYKQALEGDRKARQLRLAGAVQRQLIPRQAPEVSGIELAGIYVPCYDVGGDFYDYIELPDGRLLVTICDVMGKDVPASLRMASLRASLRAYSESFETLDKLVVSLNQAFCRDNNTGDFATLFASVYDPRNSSLTYCNAGHNPPILVRDGQNCYLPEGGMILGVMPENEYNAYEIPLNTGDLLLLYTDGLAEAVNFERESFGTDRLVQACISSASMNAKDAARNILWSMRKFTGLTMRFDDTALVVIKKI